MDFDAGKVRAFCKLRRVDEAALHIGNIGFAHFARYRKPLRLRAEIKGNCGRGQRFLPKRGRHLPARMVDLHPDMRPPRPARFSPCLETVEMAVVFQHNPAGACHGAGINHHIAGDDKPGLSFGPRLVQPQKTGGRGVVGIGHVLLHGGLGNTVWYGGAIVQHQRRKKRH
ncbi:hypothetical protein DM38_2201 [Brucella suis]|nr:hypothetical protein DM38_2201 [Brucella suis]